MNTGMSHRIGVVRHFAGFLADDLAVVKVACLEHVPQELNRQDSHGVLDRRFYRH
jgi:hypothetical protein